MPTYRTLACFFFGLCLISTAGWYKECDQEQDMVRSHKQVVDTLIARYNDIVMRENRHRKRVHVQDSLKLIHKTK